MWNPKLNMMHKNQPSNHHGEKNYSKFLLKFEEKSNKIHHEHSWEKRSCSVRFFSRDARHHQSLVCIMFHSGSTRRVSKPWWQRKWETFNTPDAACRRTTVQRLVQENLWQIEKDTTTKQSKGLFVIILIKVYFNGVVYSECITRQT